MKTIDTKNAPGAIGPYSQGKIANGMLYASGQIPLVPETGEIFGTNITEQTTQIIKNIKAILDEAGCTADDVVKTTCFLANMEDFSAFNEVYADFFTSKPARSCVAVKELPKAVLAEIEIIAICK